MLQGRDWSLAVLGFSRVQSSGFIALISLIKKTRDHGRTFYRVCEHVLFCVAYIASHFEEDIAHTMELPDDVVRVVIASHVSVQSIVGQLRAD